MSDLIAIAYADLDTAKQVARNVDEAVKGRLLEVDDEVIVEHRADGTITLHQASLAGVGALGGAVWGGFIGLLFFAPFLGMAVGAASGAAIGALGDAGVDDAFMKELGAALEPGSAALIVLVRDVDADKLLAEIKVPGTVVRTSLSDEHEAALRAALDRAGQTA